MFPYLPDQSGYHKRLKNAQPLLCKAILALSECAPCWFDDMWMTDATPVPCGISCEKVTRSEPARARRLWLLRLPLRWYWDSSSTWSAPETGWAIMWCLANPKIREREVVTALLQRNHHLIRTGQILLADKDFAGTGFPRLTNAMGLRLLRPDRKDETYRNGELGRARHWIESVNQTLKSQLDLEDHGARTPTGVFTRVAQRRLAMAAGIWHNWTTGNTSKRSLTAYDH
jgi:hypothetical protein